MPAAAKSDDPHAGPDGEADLVVGLDRSELFSSTVLLDGAELTPEGMPECVMSMRTALGELERLADRFPDVDPGGPTGAATAMVVHLALERLADTSTVWFWVPDETATWLVPAASQLPADITCDTGSVPSSGVVAFASQMLSPGGDGLPCPLRAALWFTAPLVGVPGDGVYVVWFADPSSLPSLDGEPPTPLLAGSVLPAGWSVWGHGDGLRDMCGRGDVDAHDWDRRVLSTLWHLLANPHLAEIDDVVPSRAARRRAQRGGVNPPQRGVRVVHLSPTRVGHDGGGGVRSVRWWVSGHWRSQPYGPGRALRRPVWIAPHVRGPEGAPLRAPRSTVVAVDPPR